MLHAPALRKRRLEPCNSPEVHDVSRVYKETDVPPGETRPGLRPTDRQTQQERFYQSPDGVVPGSNPLTCALIGTRVTRVLLQRCLVGDVAYRLVFSVKSSVFGDPDGPG